MGLTSYLPSAQFSLLLTSVFLAGGLIWAADYYTSPQSGPTISSVNAPSARTEQGLDWKAALQTIQGEPTLPTPPSAEVLASLEAASETDNVTEAIGRTILLSLGEAKSQGLGSDIPTQARIVDGALAKIDAASKATLYATANLTIVTDTPQAMSTYGNAVISVLERHPEASVEATLLALGNTTDSGDTSHLSELTTIRNAYRDIAEELILVSVPQTLSPLHLQITNNFVRVSAAAGDMEAVATDPLRSLAALKTFQALTEETSRLFINIAQVFNKNGILFSDSEPGAAWSLLIAP